MKNKQQGMILHDYFAMIGGGEKLVLTLAEELEWPLTGGFVSPGLKQLDEFKQLLNSLQAYRGMAPLRILSLIHKWQNYQSQSFDNMVYSGVYAPLAVANQHANHILYCHTPPRFVYDKRDYYLASLPVWQRYLVQYLIHYFQKKYEYAIKKMDSVIANSRHIQLRIKTHLGLESQVIYPPCDTHRFKWQSQQDYYLSTARLDGLKRVEKVVQAFIQMPDKKLIVASGGGEYEKLRDLASEADNISFTNWTTQEQLYQLVNNCIATIYIPKDEDFGISPVESMAAGKPVIGVNEGGLKETIKDGESGFLLDGRNDLSLQLCEQVSRLNTKQIENMRKSCELQAQNFSQEIFIEAMKSLML